MEWDALGGCSLCAIHAGCHIVRGVKRSDGKDLSMIDANTAAGLVQECVAAGERAPHEYDLQKIIMSLCGRLRSHLLDRQIPAQHREVLLPGLGLTLTAWGFFMLQAKSIEHGGAPAPWYQAVFGEHVIRGLDQLLLDARNLAREHKLSEKAQGKSGIEVPGLFRNWREPPMGGSE